MFMLALYAAVHRAPILPNSQCHPLARVKEEPVANPNLREQDSPELTARSDSWVYAVGQQLDKHETKLHVLFHNFRTIKGVKRPVSLAVWPGYTTQ